ncbi:MAG: pyruvate, phosphate dikinase [Desulfobacterales bacterium]|nr:pyruvate, phosphate dikinase [Desulfobacterales bacterium]
MFKSKALEVNLASYHVDVAIDPKYVVILEVMSRYYGLTEGLTAFLKELSHPYRNWPFIVQEARGYALDYFHLIGRHDRGVEAAGVFVDILSDAITCNTTPAIRAEAADNLLLFLQKMLKDAGDALERFLPLIDATFDRIRLYPAEPFFLFVKSFYQIKRMAEARRNRNGSGYGAINRLLHRYLKETYAHWFDQEDPQSWLEHQSGVDNAGEAIEGIFKDISLADIETYRRQLTDIEATLPPESDQMLAALLGLPGFNQVVDIYRGIPQRLLDAGGRDGRGNRWKVIFLFHIMNIPGLSLIREEALRDINRTLSWLIGNETGYYIRNLMEKTFDILKARTREFPATALNCVLNMGKGVYRTDESELINFFIDEVIKLGFQAPKIQGMGNDWQIRVNKAHIQNIRTWLELIEFNPKYSPRLLSYLTIHLALCGVFIKDTDLFPRDITRFLNSGIDPVYNLVKQLSRLFPAYFNDIGAEGLLRGISTQLDETTCRRDILIHFLRKQSHVESSNLIIGFMEAVLKYWEVGDKGLVEPFVPPSIYAQLDTQREWATGVGRVIARLREKGVDWYVDLIAIPDQRLRTLLDTITEGSATDRERVALIAAFYKMLHHKYSLDFVETGHYLAQLRAEAFPNLDRLRKSLALTDLEARLGGILNFLQGLQKMLLSDRNFEVREDIYKKRHFTVDIPSMYGRYHEMKFDAMGLTLRLESLVNVLFEELVEDIDLNLITKATFFQIHTRLKLFQQALRLDGISSVEFDRQVDLLAHSLEVRGFTFTQYLDIFKGFAQAVKNILNDYFHNVHEQNMARILSQIPTDQILEKYLPRGEAMERDKIKHRVSEIFFRDRIATSLGLQQLDRFLSRTLNTLFHQSDKLPTDKLHLLLNYDPKRAMTSIVRPKKMASGIIYLGAKGDNMLRLKDFDLPVPPGFIITTEAFRCREVIDRYPPAEQNFKDQLAREIKALEKVTGKRFGDPGNPVLFSVRSGSAISQPGMMDTFLNVGMNEEIAAGLAQKTGNDWFAWDSYRRFLQCYGMAFGLERNDFDDIISEFKDRLGIPLKRGFTGAHMQEIALTYRRRIAQAGIEIIDDPFEQLHMTIKSVFASWHSSKARTYRRIMGISDDWGTAVTVQEMVFGNISEMSGTGVIFTHNPRWSGDILKLWGDFTLENQGEDVVSGLVKTLPISVFQQEIEMRETDITLETHFPEIYQALKSWANELIYTHGWSPQEMEFTFEGPKEEDLYLLQTRDMAMREVKEVMRFDMGAISEDKFLGNGIGVSGGAMSGRLVFSLEEIDRWRGAEPETSLILVRRDTVPDDIREIFAADGLLTARGGVTSHAAVVAHRLEKTCVVGCANLICNETAKTLRFDDRRLAAGDFISIDGQEGSVYHGRIRVNPAD